MKFKILFIFLCCFLVSFFLLGEESAENIAKNSELQSVKEISEPPNGIMIKHF